MFQQIIDITREQAFDDHVSAKQQTMQVKGLRSARTILGFVGKGIPFNDAHLVKIFRKDTCGEESGDAGSKHQRRRFVSSGPGPI